MEAAKVAAVAILLILLMTLLFVSPIFTIWSLNLIFGLEIPFNFKTWCAVIWLLTMLHGIKLGYKTNE